ncbi:MAG: fibrobacter succinogenes major paralogous domain-containing protein [Bacteroidales bacterium]|nr:fibrobacter succinogenes major paralogous domain-containing protein [Bacteroidales bacterium]
MRYLKKLFLATAILLWGACAFAQVKTAYTFTAAGGTADNVYVAIGQPFYSQVSSGGYEVSYSVAQAQLIQVTVDTAICYGDGLVKYGYTFSPETPVGSYDSTRYLHTAQYNYDSTFTLHLTVNPVYYIHDTLVTYELPAGINEGDNTLEYQTIAGCDSIIYLYVIHCTAVEDFDGTTYNPIIVSGHCWTQENLRSLHYADGIGIPTHMVYQTADYPNAAANLDTYGRLYTWQSVVRVPENSTDVPVPDAASGYVQGICPNGWHVPTKNDMQYLMSNTSEALRSTNLWLIPGTNTSEFTALPAGQYNPNTSRFENLLGFTGFWTSTPLTEGTTTSAYYGRLDSWCGEYRIDEATGSYGFSVRCVKH